MFKLTQRRLLLLAVLLSGAGPVLVRDSPVGPSSTAFWRLAIALPFALWLGRLAFQQSRRDIGWALFAGILLGGDLICWNNAILKTSVMEATVLVMLFPIIVAAVEIGFFGRSLSPRLLMGTAVAFVGTFVIATGASRGQSSLVGDLLALAAAGFFACSLLISAQLCRRLDHRVVTVWVIIGAALTALPVGLTESAIVPHSPYGWAYLTFYGALTFGSYALYNNALANLSTTLVAVSGYGQPVIATGLALVLLGEIPTLGALLGAAIIVIGLALATIEPDAKSESTDIPSPRMRGEG